MVYAVSFLVFVSIMMVGIYFVEKRRLSIIQMAERVNVADSGLIGTDVGGWDIIDKTIKMLQRYFGAILPGSAVGEYDLKLMRAGFPFGLKGGDFYILKMVLGLLIPVIIPVFILLGSGKWTIVMLLAAGVTMYLVPDLWLSGKIQSRQKEIVKQLMPFIDVLAICSDAGLNLSEALKRTVEFQPGVLGNEFKRFQHELDVGINRSEALENLAFGIGLEELDILVVAINQAEKYGTPVAQMLRAQASLMREQRKNKAQEFAQKASVKILLPVILFEFLPLLVILLGPAIINIGRALGI